MSRVVTVVATDECGQQVHPAIPTASVCKTRNSSQINVNLLFGRQRENSQGGKEAVAWG